LKIRWSLATLNTTQGIIIALGLVLLMGMAALDVGAGKMTVGSFVMVNTYLIQLYLPLNILGFAYREIKVGLLNMKEMFTLLQEPQEVKDPDVPEPFLPQGGEVVFDHVRFAYDAQRPLLQDVSFRVPAGKTVAIVGSSGAGKSTLTRLLFRFYDIQGGRILIDGQDVAMVRQRDVRQAIGIVPQDTVLFNDTLGYNIRYGSLTATEEDIKEAAKMAQIHDFIETLPDKYDTLVGERGLKLSGGERQRVSIARMLLKKPTIFVFDEATSALDTQTEKEIQKSLRDVSLHHTTLIIAHRLSTVVDADEILVMEGGRVVERGTHTDLLSQKGLYAQLWRRQKETSASLGA
jgi:ATP-binding cassette subfamily B protein